MKKAYKFFRGMTLLLCCLGATTMFSQTFNGTGGAIPDNSCGPASLFPLTVSGVAPGASLSQVTINVTHTWDSDLDIFLLAPNGAAFELTTDNGSSGDNYVNTVFSASAANSITTGTAPFTGTYLPEGSFASVAGQNNGVWTLRACDDLGGDTGTLGAWSITFGTVAPPPPMYCTSVPTSNDGLGISNLTLGTTAFTIPDVTYSNQTATPVTIQQGLSVNTQITFRTGYTYDTHIWVDFNDNAVFETSERVYTGVSASTNPTTLNASWPLSASAAIGPHRMRIGTADTGQLTPNPCYSGSYGVTIDATVNVIAPLCAPAVVGASVISPDCSNNQYYVNVNVTSVGEATTFSNGQAVQAGVNQVGPFTNGSSAAISVNHSTAACNFNVGTFTYNCPPANDTCNTAAGVTCGSSVSGSTQYANNETGISFCGTTATSAPGVWYKLEGTGGDIVLSTADSAYDTKLFLYSGACGALTCVDGDDDDGPGLTSELTFSSAAGASYYVYVTGFGSASGTYNLTVQCVCEASFNDDCATVYSGYAPSSSTQLTATGQFGLAPYTYALSDGQTNNTGVFTVTPTSTTVYEVTITDAALCMSTAETTVVVVDVQCGNGNNESKVTICHNGHEICVSPNAVQAHLNHGDSLGNCGSATCETTPVCDARLKVPGPFATNVPTDIVLAWGAATGYASGYLISIGTSPGGTDVLNGVDVGNTLTYDPDLNYATTYYVTIVAYNSNGNAFGGCQESSFTTVSPPWCNGGELVCGSSYNESTNGVNPDDSQSTCSMSSYGKWYKIAGTGEEMTINVVPDSAGYDTELSLSSGDCTSLTGIDCVDDGFSASDPETITFTSAAGTSYFLFVAHWLSGSTTTGNYTISLTCSAPPPPLQACIDAVGVSCNSTTTGSTVGYSANPELGTCTTTLGAGPGRFYKVEGTGSNITVNTCGSGFDTKLGVFSGSCGALQCVTGNDDTSTGCGAGFVLQSSVTFASQVGTVYYIYVTGFLQNAGDFILNVSCGAPRVADPLTWNMYPNPATKGEVQLDLTNYLDQDLGIQLMDFSGKVLSNDSLINLQNPHYSIKTQTMSNGLYFVRVATENGVTTKKLIIAN